MINRLARKCASGTRTLVACALVCLGRALPVSADTSWRDCPQCPLMTMVPAGRFLLGSPAGAGDSDEFVFEDGLPDPVQIDRPFALGVHEVTVGEFRAFVAATGYETVAEKRGGCQVLLPGGFSGFESAWNWRNPGYVQTESHPVTCVSWSDAMAYVVWLRQRTGKAYRLPSEAEFEYVARAGDRLLYGPTGAIAGVCTAGNVAGTELQQVYPTWTTAPCSDRSVWPTPVGARGLAPWGVHDLYGNMSEWMDDCYAAKHGWFELKKGVAHRRMNAGKARQTFCASPLQRVIKGPSWSSAAHEARLGRRSAEDAARRTNWIGMRVAL